MAFDSVEIGRPQAQGLLKAVDIDGGKWTKANPLQLVELGGSPTDFNARLFRKGQDEIVQPYVDRGLIEVVADQWVDNWDPAIAQLKMNNILAARWDLVDAVLASNDSTALGALQTLQARKLAGVVKITGQDATVDACHSILRDEMTLTILKDWRGLPPLTVDLVDKLLQGQTASELHPRTLAEITNDQFREGFVMAAFLPTQMVTKDNLYDLIVKSGYLGYDEVYQDVPPAQRPPKP